MMDRSPSETKLQYTVLPTGVARRAHPAVLQQATERRKAKHENVFIGARGTWESQERQRGRGKKR